MSENTWQPTLESLFDCWRLFFQLPADELMHKALEVAAQSTRSSHASFMALDRNESVLITRAAVEPSPGAIAAEQARLREELADWVAQNKRPLWLPGGPDELPFLQKTLQLGQIAAALCVPVKVDGRVLGVLNLLRQGDGAPFTPQDLWFVSLLADRLGMALNNARLNDLLASRERSINHIQNSIPSSLVVIDRDLRIVSANRNFLEKARRDAQNTLGRKMGEVLPPVLVQYTRMDRKIQEIFHTGQSLEGGKVAYRAPGLPSRT